MKNTEELSMMLKGIKEFKSDAFTYVKEKVCTKRYLWTFLANGDEMNKLRRELEDRGHFGDVLEMYRLACTLSIVTGDLLQQMHDNLKVNVSKAVVEQKGETAIWCDEGEFTKTLETNLWFLIVMLIQLDIVIDV